MWHLVRGGRGHSCSNLAVDMVPGVWVTGKPMGPAAGLGIKPHVRVCPEISGTCYKPRTVTSIRLSISTSLEKIVSNVFFNCSCMTYILYHIQGYNSD